MLEDSERPESGTSVGQKERCKPDYETMTANLQKKYKRSNDFKEATLNYFEGKREGKRARNKMAELIGELVTECNMFAGEIQKLLKTQENDQD